MYPYNDEEMNYKPYPTARYVLTVDYVKTILGIDLTDRSLVVSANPSIYATRTLDRISRKVYRYLLENAMNTVLWQRIIAKTPSVRQMIRDMMLAEIEYEMTGANPITARDRERISPETEDIANNIIVPEIGACLRYVGDLNIGVPFWLQGEF